MDTIKKSEMAVKMAVAAAAATGVIPIPFADAPLLVGEQVAMMGAIAKIFEIDIREDGLKTLAVATLGVSGATIVGRTVVSGILKIIPGLGLLVGGVLSGVAAGAITYAIGMAFIEVCKAIRLGRLNEDEITSKDGVAMFLGYFRDIVRRGNGKPVFSSDADYRGDEERRSGKEDDEGGE